MRGLKLSIVAVVLCILLLWTGVAVGAFNKQNIVDQKKVEPDALIARDNTDDFYFVQITDTHVMHKLFDHEEVTANIFKTVIETVTSLVEKPAFVVITGDLVEWGGSSISGALNYQTFLSCLYEKDDQLYADPGYSIPVYTTPGNHDYNFNRNLRNYHRFIDKNHVDDRDRYVVTYGNVGLFFMDSGPNYYDRPEDWFDILGDGLYNCDIAWLENALNNCSSQHKIILMHHPAVNYRNEHGEMTDVIARNREVFLELCEDHNVDMVLAGHTHHAVVFDGEEEVYNETALPLNCSLYPTLYVQSDDCKQGCHYRNISIVGDDILIETSEEIEVTSVNINQLPTSSQYQQSNELKNIFMLFSEAIPLALVNANQAQASASQSSESTVTVAYADC